MFQYKLNNRTYGITLISLNMCTEYGINHGKDYYNIMLYLSKYLLSL